MHPKPFASDDDFESLFVDRLRQLLRLPPDRDALGLYILVLANASMLPQLLEQLGDELRARYRQLAALPSDHWADTAPDDCAVFERLADFDLSQPPRVEYREVGPWRLQYNPLRSLRPARNSQARITALRQPFDEQGFHFDKPFLEREILWRGELAGTDLRLLFNKFPFARHHCLTLIDATAHRPQFLSAQDLDQLLRVMDTLKPLKGLALAWNSLGAQASVNHQHWQMTLSEQTYPVEAGCWLHNGGTEAYPLEVERYGNEHELWHAIDDCQNGNQAFNLFLRPGRYWLLKRRLQGDYQMSDWIGGLAWSEACGVFSLSDEAAFRGLTREDIETELARLRIA